MAKVEVKVVATAIIVVDTNDSIDGYDIEELNDVLDDDYNDSPPEAIAEAMVRVDDENGSLPLDEFEWTVTNVRNVGIISDTIQEVAPSS